MKPIDAIFGEGGDEFAGFGREPVDDGHQFSLSLLVHATSSATIAKAISAKTALLGTSRQLGKKQL